MTPVDEIPVVTPLGTAMCFGVNSHIAAPVWACWIESTQELWWFGNRHIRRRPTVTTGNIGISPFAYINAPLRRQIERYKANGWLPADYDPEDIGTWKL